MGYGVGGALEQPGVKNCQFWGVCKDLKSVVTTDNADFANMMYVR